MEHLVPGPRRARAEASPRATSMSLLERARDLADADAWARLCAIYGPWIGRQFRRLGAAPADTEDLTQDVLGILLRRLPEFRHNGRAGAFRAYVRTVAVSVLRKHQRRLGPMQRRDIDGILASLEDDDSGIARRWDLEHDRHVIHALMETIRGEFQPGTWEAFRLLMIEGLAAAEVASRLGTTVNAVLIARSRVLARLRAEIRGLTG